MIDTSKMTRAEIRRAAMRAVVREVGVAGLVCLLRDETPSSGNYMADRERWLPEFGSVEEMMETLEREGKPETPPS